ncbi:MAG: hypothetical protein ACO1NU_08650 [Arcticibacter sp.]
METDSSAALRRISKYTPVKFEADQESRRKLQDRLDSLLKSKAFFEEQYFHQDGAQKYLTQISGELELIESKLLVIPESLTIGDLYRQDPDKTDDCIVLILNDLRMFFQVDKVINTDGLYSLASIITTQYRHLTLEELAICMNMAKLGEYGQVYNRLDGAIILGWIKKYNTEKQSRLNERNYVKEVHVKIGIDEGRSGISKEEKSQMMNTSQTMVDIWRANNNKKSSRPAKKA